MASLAAGSFGSKPRDCTATRVNRWRRRERTRGKNIDCGNNKGHEQQRQQDGWPGGAAVSTPGSHRFGCARFDYQEKRSIRSSGRYESESYIDPSTNSRGHRATSGPGGDTTGQKAYAARCQAWRRVSRLPGLLLSHCRYFP